MIIEENNIPKKYSPDAVLPSGKALNIRFFRHLNTSLTPCMLKAIERNHKEYLPQLILWPKGETQLVCCDFDTLPDCCGDWGTLEDRLLSWLGDRGLVFRSTSGKVKALLLVQPSDVDVSVIARDTIVNALSGVFGFDSNWESCLDFSESAISTTFISADLKEKLVWISTLQPTRVIYDSVAAAAPLRSYAGDLPSEVIEFLQASVRGAQKRSNMEGLVRILLDSPGLLEKFDLPLRKLAGQMKCDVASVSRYIRLLVASGWLKVVSNGYFPGKKAKSYRAINILSTLIRKCRSAKIIVLKALPKFIPDGQWYQQIFSVANQFVGKGLRQFESYIKTLPNWSTKKDRLSKAKYALNYIDRKRNGARPTERNAYQRAS